ncbi:MAG: RNA methyltransferase [Candidatus Zixiibacteriota bacterium]
MLVPRTELKKLSSLLTKKERRRHRMFLAEGVRVLEEAVRHGFLPHTVYYAPSDLSARGRKLIDRFRQRSVKVETVSTRDLRVIADTETPQGVVALFSLPETGLSELFRSAFRRLLLCENIADPGNLGTLIRSALAFGFDMVILAGDSAEPYAPKAVRSSAGAIFGIPIAVATLSELLRFIGQEKPHVIAADPKGSDKVALPRRLNPKRRLLVAVGSEAKGLSREILRIAGRRVRIDHLAVVES